MQRLQWAISNAEVNFFFFYEKAKSNFYRSNENSAAFVKAVLLSFQRGSGHYLNDRSFTEYRHHNSIEEEGEKKFREALSTQIHALTGVKPRISLDDDGYVIFYS